MRKWGSQFRLGEVEPSFKEFLASPAMIRLELLSSKANMGRAKSFQLAIFKELCHYEFLDLSCSRDLSL
jgi:hypothetical protein